MPIQQILLGAGSASINDFEFTLQNNGFHQAEANENTIHYRFYSAGVTTTSSGSSYTLTGNASQHLASVGYFNGWNVITTRSDRQGKIKVRVKGASGGTTNGAGGGASIKGYRNWGRDVEATFTWSGQKVFYIGLGSVGQSVGWQYNSNSTGGASGAGGATCFVYKSGSDYYPIMIGAGGGGATNNTTVISHYKAQSSSNRERYMGSAVPLSGPSTGSAVHTPYDWRNWQQSGNNYGTNHRKGIGRTNSGTGGAGWENLGYPTTHQGAQAQAFFSHFYFVKPGFNTGVDDSNSSDNTQSTYISGGWGGGGAGFLGSAHPPGAGGFFGGWEQDYNDYSTTTYEPKFTGSQPGSAHNEFGAISFCSPPGGADTRGDEDGTKQTDIAYVNNSLTDNGWHHKRNDGSDAWKLYDNTNTPDREANGTAIIEFKDVEAI